jgi:predicted ATP-grasp superfamily ATP-dependent carboligase
MKKLECIKGFTDSQNLRVLCLQGDFVKVLDINENWILIEIIAGWMAGAQLSLTPKQVAECFKVIGITYYI